VDKPFIEWVLSFGNAGNAFLIILVGCSTFYGVYKFFKEIIVNHNKKISNQTKEDIEDSSFKHEMNDLIADVKSININLNNSITTNAKSNEELKAQISNIENQLVENRKSAMIGDKKLESRMDEQHNFNEEMKAQLTNINRRTILLIESSKEEIKTTITTEYYNAISKGCIPMYKLESLESLYQKYLQSNGNTFVEQMMKELRNLPHDINNE